ncbi:MAG: WD40 repeat domain-containing protein [Spirochaetales bacterium]|nr:WD40 repeat domain-containing protein [Spirochaetales bacterium]
MDEKEKVQAQLSFPNRSAPDLIKEEFGSIIQLAGILESFEKLIVKKVVEEDLGYHFMMSHYLSKDKKYCVTAGTDGAVVLWDLEQRKLLRIFKGHTHHVTAVCMTPDNKTIISGSKDNTIRIWEIATGKCRILEKLMSAIFCLAINNDGSYIVSGGKDNTVRLWQIQTGRLIKTYRQHNRSVLCVSFSPDGTTFVSGGGDGKCIEWKLFTDSYRILYQGAHIVDALCISPDGSFVSLVGREHALYVINRKSGKVIKQIETQGMTVFDIAISKDSTYLAVCGRPRKIKIFKLPGGVCVKTLSVCNEHIHKIDYIDNDKTLLTTSGDTTIRIIYPETEKIETILKGDGHVIRSVGLSSNNKYLAAGTGNGEVKIWDMTTCKLVHTLRGHQGLIRSLVFDPRRSDLFSAGWDGIIISWDMSKFKAREINKELDERIYTLFFNTVDNTIFAADHTGLIIHLDENLRECGKKFNARGFCYTISANKRYLAAGSGPRIMIWDLVSGHEREIKGHIDDIYALVLHPMKPYLLSASMDGSIRLWNIETGGTLKEFRGHEGRVTNVTADYAFKRVFSVGTDGTLREWNITTGECGRIYRGHTSPVHGLVFIENLNLILTGSDDGTICFWESTPETGNTEPADTPDARLSLYNDFFLWTLRPEKKMREGWFFTDHTEKLCVVKKNEHGTILQELKQGDLDRETHVSAYNRPDIVSARIINRTRYYTLLKSLDTKGRIRNNEKNNVKRITDGTQYTIP